MPEKILLISYFFSPCNMTAAQRTTSWAENLVTAGYYPIVIARRWDHFIHSQEDIEKATENEIIHKKEHGYEVFYLPYKPNFRARFSNRFGLRFGLLRKSLIFCELLFNNFNHAFLDCRSFFPFLSEYLKKEPIKKAIISAEPFSQFQLGYYLHKKFNVEWIADYRDAWSTEVYRIKKQGFFYDIIKKVESRSELKWVSSAKYVTTVSPHYAQIIGAFLGRQTEVVMNGFFENEIIQKHQLDSGCFNGIFIGTLYEKHQVEVFIKELINLIHQYKDKINIHFYFPGIEYAVEAAARVRKCIKGYEQHFTLTKRIPKEEIIELRKKMDYSLLLTGGTEAKGVSSSKIFDYVASLRPIICFPDDQDIVNHILNETKLGLICDTNDEIYFNLEALIKQKISGKDPYKQSTDAIKPFSRNAQFNKLLELTNKL